MRAGVAGATTRAEARKRDRFGPAEVWFGRLNRNGLLDDAVLAQGRKFNRDIEI